MCPITSKRNLKKSEIKEQLKDYRIQVIRVYREICLYLQKELPTGETFDKLTTKLGSTQYFRTHLPIETMHWGQCVEYKSKAIDILDEIYLKGEETFQTKL